MFSSGMTNRLVKFNANGDPPGRYTIYQYQKKGNNKYGYIPIGNWQSGLQMDLTMAKWKNGSTHLPTSVCSEPCPSGSVKSSEGICCWTCIPCDEDEVQNQFPFHSLNHTMFTNGKSKHNLRVYILMLMKVQRQYLILI